MTDKLQKQSDRMREEERRKYALLVEVAAQLTGCEAFVEIGDLSVSRDKRYIAVHGLQLVIHGDATMNGVEVGRFLLEEQIDTDGTPFFCLCNKDGNPVPPQSFRPEEKK